MSPSDDRERSTYDALVDVDTGQVIDHQEVLAWADSLSSNFPLSLPASHPHKKAHDTSWASSCSLRLKN